MARRVPLALLGVLCLTLGTARAATSSDVEPKAPAAASESGEQTARAGKPRFPVFVPPVLGAPRTRVGGASRGPVPQGYPEVEALVPEHVGLTIAARPVLYWYLSKPSSGRVDFTLIDEESPSPLIEVTLPGPFEAGVQRIDLARFDVELQAGVVYEWYVAFVPDPERRSNDVLAGGAIELQPASPDLRSELKTSSAERVPFVLAQHGIWYDAVDDLSRRISASPDDELLRRQRAALLSQVGLLEVAEADSTP